MLFVSFVVETPLPRSQTICHAPSRSLQAVRAGSAMTSIRLKISEPQKTFRTSVTPPLCAAVKKRARNHLVPGTPDKDSVSIAPENCFARRPGPGHSPFTGGQNRTGIKRPQGTKSREQKNRSPLPPPASCLLPPASCLLPPASCLPSPACHKHRLRSVQRQLNAELTAHYAMSNSWWLCRFVCHLLFDLVIRW